MELLIICQYRENHTILVFYKLLGRSMFDDSCSNQSNLKILLPFGTMSKCMLTIMSKLTLTLLYL